MLLAVDIGNSCISTGIFDGDSLVKTVRMTSDKFINTAQYRSIIQSFFEEHYVTDCIIGSVVDEITDNIKQGFDSVCHVDSIVVSPNIDLGVKIKTEHPEEMGADRIANAYAAKKLYSKSAIIVDMGTATTFDIIDKNCDFTGGLILAGVGLQLKMLSEGTSKLPELKPEEITNVIGIDTKSCIMSGAVAGHACAIDGLLDRCIEELGYKPMLIATGGYCNLISEYMNHKFDEIDQQLTLKGLKYLYDLNFDK